MPKFPLLVLLPLTIAACTIQIVPPAGTPPTPDVDIQIQSSAKPKPAASPESQKYEVSDAYVKAYEAVAVAKPGAAIALTVRFGLSDPLHSFDKLTVEVDEKAMEIHVKATQKIRIQRSDEPGIAAPSVIVDSSASTEFTVKTPGRYTFVSPRYLSGAPKTAIEISELEAAPLLTIQSQGGLCPDGPCGRKIQVMSDGSYTIPGRDGESRKGQLPEAVRTLLAGEVEKADFVTLKSVPFTGTCPTAYDGQEVIYTFYTAKGLEELSTCTFQIDDTAALFQAVAAVEKVVNAEAQ